MTPPGKVIALLDRDENDQARRDRNRAAGHTLCGRCEGTGNQLYYMYQRCEDCHGSGVEVRYGELSRLRRWWIERRERREVRRPREWSAEVRFRLSRWFGIGHWFGGRDRCWRCGADPFDVEYEMRRVRPFRAECLCREWCDEATLEGEGETNGC